MCFVFRYTLLWFRSDEYDNLVLLTNALRYYYYKCPLYTNYVILYENVWDHHNNEVIRKSFLTLENFCEIIHHQSHYISRLHIQPHPPGPTPTDLASQRVHLYFDSGYCPYPSLNVCKGVIKSLRIQCAVLINVAIANLLFVKDFVLSCTHHMFPVIG